MKQNCVHPNCRLFATKPHPRHENAGNELCDTHYIEISAALGVSLHKVTSTYQNK